MLTITEDVVTLIIAILLISLGVRNLIIFTQESLIVSLLFFTLGILFLFLTAKKSKK